MIAAGLAAWPLGRLTVTLKSDYLAVTAIGFSEVVRSVLENEMWLTGGPSGLPGIPSLFGHLSGLDRSIAIFAVLLAGTLLVFLVLEALARSPFGRALRSIRDDDIAAAAL